MDLGLATSPARTRVVVAMSGGVDSAVTAALLAEAGYDVVGITLQLYDHGAAINKKGACCAGADIQDARTVADRLGIRHYVLDYEQIFRQAVMQDFADTYAGGATPIPCVRCNQKVKFRDLLQTAKDLGAAVLATGHYAQRLTGVAGPELHRAADDRRDQSYFLFTTTPEQLDFIRFPLGGMAKDVTRQHAQRLGLAVAEKPDSQDICFVPTGNYAQVVQKLRPDAAEPGNIVDREGRVLGAHAGIIHFTVGQRKGLGALNPNGEPLYVLELRADSREVVVGPQSALGRQTVYLQDINWLDDRADPGPVMVRLRSAQPLAPACIRHDTDGQATVRLDSPQLGVAPGQACVVYQGTRVLGGGWIRQAA